MQEEYKDIIGFQFPIEDKSERIIKVIGVGGGGGNAVQNMCKTQIHNASFVVCNTDSQAFVNGNQKCSDFGNSECSIFGIKTTVLLASAVQ